MGEFIFPVSDCSVFSQSHRYLYRCTVNNSVICDGVELGEKCSLKDCLIGSQRILQPGSECKNTS